jgi:hypothetical protein
VHNLSFRVDTEDRDTLKEMIAALHLRTYGDLMSYLADRYRAGALHIIPAFSSQVLYDEQQEILRRIARTEARKECRSVLYEERFITDPKVR